MSCASLALAMVSLNEADRSNEDLRELECPVCHDLFKLATSLNCSHTYCDTCITQCLRNDNRCPICRTAVTAKVHSLAMDNYIRKVRGRLSIKILSTNRTNWQRSSGRKRNRRRRRRNRNRGINQQTTAAQQHRAFQSNMISTPQRTQSQGVFPHHHQPYHENMNYNHDEVSDEYDDESGEDEEEYDEGSEEYDEESGEEEEYDEGSEEYDEESGEEEEQYDEGSEDYDEEMEEEEEQYDEGSEDYDEEMEEEEQDDEDSESDDESDDY